MSPFPVRKRCLSRTAGCSKGIGIEYGDLDFHIMHSSLFVRDRPVRHAKAQLVTGPFLETRMGFEEHRLLKIDEVTRMCAISRSALYDLISHGQFPAAVRVGVRAVAWRQTDVLDWI